MLWGDATHRLENQHIAGAGGHLGGIKAVDIFLRVGLEPDICTVLRLGRGGARQETANDRSDVVGELAHRLSRIMPEGELELCAIPRFSRKFAEGGVASSVPPYPAGRADRGTSGQSRSTVRRKR